MRVFIDTSAFFAILDADDENYQKAKQIWVDLLRRETVLVCSNYVLVEAFALVQHRLGIQAIRTFQEDIVPTLTIAWVDESCHGAGTSNVLTAGTRNLSLVDCVSFELMRRLGITTAFTFDHHFKEQRFECMP